MSRYFRAGTLHIGDKNVKDWKYMTILPGWFPASNLRLEAESTAALLQRRKNRVTVVMQLRIILLGGTAMLGYYSTPENAFYLGYKPFKEDIIKRVAQIEYDNGNITEECYKAMMNYEVEITD